MATINVGNPYTNAGVTQAAGNAAVAMGGNEDNGSPAGTAAMNAASNAPGPATTAQPTAAQQQDTANGQNATQQIGATLNSLGLGGMTQWATNLAYSLAGQGIDPTDIVNTITSQMNNPTDANGQVDQGALQAFNSALPGFNQLIANTGQNGSPGSSPAQAIANYINYNAQVQQFSQQAGLLPGTITANEIGNLWANQVSTTEVSERITMATVSATSAPQQVQDYLATNFGMTPQALTSYYLNPTNTLQNIQTNMNTGMVGGEAAITGFDKDLSVANAQALGAFLANGASGGSSTAVGGVNAVTAGAAGNAFTSNLGGGIQGPAAQLAGLETATPGQNAGSTVNENELLSAMGVPGEGSTQAQALVGVSNAQQTRTAGARGGGGAATTSNGAAGLGFAQQEEDKCRT